MEKEEFNAVERQWSNEMSPLKRCRAQEKLSSWSEKIVFLGLLVGLKMSCFQHYIFGNIWKEVRHGAREPAPIGASGAVTCFPWSVLSVMVP